MTHCRYSYAELWPGLVTGHPSLNGGGPLREKMSRGPRRRYKFRARRCCGGNVVTGGTDRRCRWLQRRGCEVFVAASPTLIFSSLPPTGIPPHPGSWLTHHGRRTTPRVYQAAMTHHCRPARRRACTKRRRRTTCGTGERCHGQHRRRRRAHWFRRSARLPTITAAPPRPSPKQRVLAHDRPSYTCKIW